MDSLHLTSTSPNAGVYRLRSVVNQAIDRAKLKAELVQKQRQRLYAQMLKDGITSKALRDKVSAEIADLNTKLHAR